MTAADIIALAKRWGHRFDPRRSLPGKLSLLYTALLSGAVALTLTATRYGIERYAEQVAGREMAAGSKVFDRLTAMRYAQLGDAGRVLAADFGFRAAVATGDPPTITSALTSLRGRLGLSQAFLVTINGDVIGYRGELPETEARSLFEALDDGASSGVIQLANQPYSAASAPVKAPVLLGWVVFAKAIDARELSNLAQMSAIGLKPAIMPVSRLPRDLRLAPMGTAPPTERMKSGERILIEASPVQSFGKGVSNALVLQYSLTRALAAYAPIFWMLFSAAIVSIAITIAGSWALARKLTGPIRELDAAAQRVSAGDYAQVPVRTGDEIGRLAASFNRMVDDMGERERQIEHMALHDSLTGLPNRALLRQHLGMVLARQVKGSTAALFCLDLDNFKAVNDTLGHPTGDALLCEIARRIEAHCGTGFVARLGGDEFAVVIQEDRRAINRIANDLIAAISHPCVVTGHRVVPGTSIGIAIAGQDGDDITTLLRNADLALYRAKENGKGRFSFFEAGMDAEAQDRRQLELDLHDAISGGQLSLMFQPLFDLEKGRVSAFEALLRWHHPHRGTISPVDFIPLAEETGLIVPIGEWVIREACRVAMTWPDDIRIAVNVSPVQVRKPGLTAVIFQALSESGLPANRLELEITESLFMENVEAALAPLHSLRALGVRVALDDFGTGYSSLSYLRSFPFDKIKIDRSFIIDLMSSEGATAIIKAITTLAGALGMETTAEGVENVGQLDILREQGCSHIQGFYFSRPIPEDEVRKLLRKENKDAVAAA